MMTKMIDEFEKWLSIQEKPSVNGEMTLGVINEYRTHMCKHAFEGGFNSAQALLSQGELVKPYGYVYVSDGNFLFKKELTENEIFFYSSLPVYNYWESLRNK